MNRYEMKTDHFKNRITAVLVATISITTLVLALVLFLNFQEVISFNIYTAEKNNLSQVSYITSFMADMSTSTAMQMLTNTYVQKLLRQRSLTAKEQYEALNQLYSFSNSYFSAFYDSIYIYNGSMNMIYSSSTNSFSARYSKVDNFFDQDIVALLQDRSGLPSDKPICRAIKVPGIAGEAPYVSYVYTYIFTDIMRSDKSISSALILNINASWIYKMILGIDSNYLDSTLIINQDGQQVSVFERDQFMSDLSGEHYVARILGSETDAGYFDDIVNDAKSLIVYKKSLVNNWVLIRIFPMQKIMLAAEQVKMRTILISASVFFVVLLFLLFYSRKIKSWADYIVAKLNSLEMRAGKVSVAIIQEFIRELLLNTSSLSDEYIRDELLSLRIQWNPYLPYFLVLCKMRRDLSYTDENGLENINNMKLSIIGEFEKKFSPLFPCVTINVDTEYIALLINANSIETIMPHLSDVLHNKHEKYPVAVSLIISEIIRDDIRSLYQIYQKLTYQLHYSIFHESSKILSSGNIKEIRADDFQYPIHEEEKLLHALNLNKTDDIPTIFETIIDSFYDAPYHLFNAYIVRLAFSIIQAANQSILFNTEKSKNFLASSFISEINKAETVEGIKSRFYALFREIMQRNDNRKNAKADNMYDKIKEYIDQRYCNPNISITFIASDLNFSPAYFGRLFKKYFGISFVDYLNKKRLEQAIELLLSTNDSIKTIAERVGFTNVTYFYKVFRKALGITPTEYRRKNV